MGHILLDDGVNVNGAIGQDLLLRVLHTPLLMIDVREGVIIPEATGPDFDLVVPVSIDERPAMLRLCFVSSGQMRMLRDQINRALEGEL